MDAVRLEGEKELIRGDSVFLKQRIFCINEKIPAGAFACERMQAQILRDFDWDGYTLRLWTYILAEDLETKTYNFEAKWPSTPWQHFKEKYFPRWLLARFPVEYSKKEQTVEFTARAYYPKAANIPKVGGHVLKLDFSIEHDSDWDKYA